MQHGTVHHGAGEVERGAAVGVEHHLAENGKKRKKRKFDDIKGAPPSHGEIHICIYMHIYVCVHIYIYIDT